MESMSGVSKKQKFKEGTETHPEERKRSLEDKRTKEVRKPQASSTFRPVPVDSVMYNKLPSEEKSMPSMSLPGYKKKKKIPTPKIDRNPINAQLDAYQEEKDGSESDSEAGSEKEEYHGVGKTVSRRQNSTISMHTNSTSSSESSSGSSFTNDSLDSSIHKYRDEFEDFKCKMRIFGESLNLCNCIAKDFKGKLSYMERKLHGLEKRQKYNKTHNNYTEIIQKNKQLETKTKAFVAKLQKCGTEEEMREVAGRICKNYLHGLWKVVHSNEIMFRRISGGLSNFIYVVGLPEDLKPLYARLSEMEEDEVKAIHTAMEAGDEPKQVLLRIYGQVHGERAMDAIVTESVIFTLLSERRLGPKLFGVFSGGRIEEFIPARPLLTKELAEPAISMKIAEKTAAIHSMEIPLSKEPNYIWKTMYKWLKTVKEECFTNGIKGKNEIEKAAIAKLKDMNYDTEIEWLKKYLLTFDSPVVFCHNDLQEGNILLLEGEQQLPCDEYESSGFVPTYEDHQGSKNLGGLPDTDSVRLIQNHTSDAWLADELESSAGKAAFLSKAHLMQSPRLEEEDTMLSEPPGEPKLYLIDFEYCAYNYRAFDIANHFQEWGYDYTNPEHPFYFERQEDWPTIEQKEIFIREYLKYYQANLTEDKQPVDPDIDAVNKLLAEVEAFTLASHLFWTLWSIVNASKSQIPFGYWEYGQSRLDTYLRLKQEVIKKEQLGLPHKRKIEEVDI